METLKNWRYTPAMCGTTPVATEKEIAILLFEAGGAGAPAAEGAGDKDLVVVATATGGGQWFFLRRVGSGELKAA